MTSWPICVYERLLNFWPIAINCITTSGSRIGMQIRIQFSYRPMADHYQSNAQQRAGRTNQKPIGQRTTTEDEESPLDDHRTSVLYTLEASSVSICLSVCLALAEEGSPITKDCACRHRKAIILGIYWWTQRPFRGVSHPVLPPPASFSLFIFVPLMVCVVTNDNNNIISHATNWTKEPQMSLLRYLNFLCSFALFWPGLGCQM